VIQQVADYPGEVLLSDGFATEVLEGLKRRLQDLANDAQLQIRELACTMLVGIICEGRAGRDSEPCRDRRCAGKWRSGAAIPPDEAIYEAAYESLRENVITHASTNTRNGVLGPILRYWDMR
jgi:hypothetical protein